MNKPTSDFITFSQEYAKDHEANLKRWASQDNNQLLKTLAQEVLEAGGTIQ